MTASDLRFPPSTVDESSALQASAKACVMMTPAAEEQIERLNLTCWSPDCAPTFSQRALDALESGRIVFLPDLSFELTGEEQRFLDPGISNGKAKNVSFDPRTGMVGGTSLRGRAREELAALLDRFGAHSRALVTGLFPRYRSRLELGRTSLRPVRIGGWQRSYRKDDTLLHADAFPSRPVQGRRILRVFANVDPDGVERVWRVGEPFEDCARRFLPRQKPAVPGSAALLQALGITKGRRTEYDRLMLGLHDHAKADTEYQRAAIRAEIPFPAGSTWIVFTDRVCHAAIAGQHALEQTFYLPVAAMADSRQAPLRILERLIGRSLLN